MAGLYRQFYSSFWSDPSIIDSFSPEDRYFYMYLITNEHTNLCGIYEISLKQISFDTGYSSETVKALIDRFQGHLKRIRYNPETHEMAILNWAKYNYPEKTTDNRFACIKDELKTVKDKELVLSVIGHASDVIKTELTNMLSDSHDEKPHITPLQAPSMPHHPVLVLEKALVQEGDTAPARENSPGENQSIRGAELQVPITQLHTEIPHLKITERWFKKFNKITGITTLPDERSILAAKKLLEFLNGNINTALNAVDYYFENWQDLWFACDKATRKGSRESRIWEFRFGSFSTPENIQEILSKMKSLPKKAESREPYSTGAPPVPDDELATPEQRRDALSRIKNLNIAKTVKLETAQ